MNRRGTGVAGLAGPMQGLRGPANGRPGPEAAVATSFELYRDRKGEFRWRLRHRNGNILATSSEGYKARADAMRCIENVKNSGESPVSEV